MTKGVSANGENGPEPRGVTFRAGLAYGLGIGFSVVYFVGLVNGLSLGTLVWRSAVGGAVFGLLVGLGAALIGNPVGTDEDGASAADGDDGGADTEGGG